MASWFLWIAGVVFLVAFAVPLLLAPRSWARALRWRVPADTDLVVYLGRCLGAVAVAVIVACFRAAPEPGAHPEIFELVIAVGVMMTAVHGWGALRRTQPWTETAEIGLYVVLTVLAIWIRAGL